MAVHWVVSMAAQKADSWAARLAPSWVDKMAVRTVESTELQSAGRRAADSVD